MTQNQILFRKKISDSAMSALVGKYFDTDVINQKRVLHNFLVDSRFNGFLNFERNQEPLMFTVNYTLAKFKHELFDIGDQVYILLYSDNSKNDFRLRISHVELELNRNDEHVVFINANNLENASKYYTYDEKSSKFVFI